MGLESVLSRTVIAISVGGGVVSRGYGLVTDLNSIGVAPQSIISLQDKNISATPSLDPSQPQHLRGKTPAATTDQGLYYCKMVGNHSITPYLSLQQRYIEIKSSCSYLKRRPTSCCLAWPCSALEAWCPGWH